MLYELFDAVSELLLEITLKGNALWVITPWDYPKGKCSMSYFREKLRDDTKNPEKTHPGYKSIWRRFRITPWDYLKRKCSMSYLRDSASGRTFEKSSAMTPETLNKRELVINQFDAVSELLFEITLKGNALWVIFPAKPRIQKVASIPTVYHLFLLSTPLQDRLSRKAPRWHPKSAIGAYWL